MFAANCCRSRKHHGYRAVALVPMVPLSGLLGKRCLSPKRPQMASNTLILMPPSFYFFQGIICRIRVWVCSTPDRSYTTPRTATYPARTLMISLCHLRPCEHTHVACPSHFHRLLWFCINVPHLSDPLTGYYPVSAIPRFPCSAAAEVFVSVSQGFSGAIFHM